MGTSIIEEYNEDELPAYTPMPWYVRFSLISFDDTYCSLEGL